MKRCKLCNLAKELSEFYKQKWWSQWVKWECKICYKSKRRTDQYRQRDRDRYHNDPERNKKQKEYTKEWAIRFPEKRKAQRDVWNYYRWKRKLEKPTSCCVCNSKERIHMHHEDYNYPNKVYPMCNICHANKHAWNLELDSSFEITLDFSDKRKHKTK